MKYRLGLDMGATSLGWCVLELDENDIPRSVTDMGVRIFSDGRNAKDKKPLSVSRREKRAARRNRDRFILRRNDLIKALVDHDLMPKDKVARKSIASIDPYQSRASAVKEKVSLHVLGRSLFHINQRRGFKSNRIVDQQDGDDELTGMKSGIELLRGRLAERTLGQYLFDRHQKLQSVRMRPHQGKSNKNEWDFYADRAMYEEEFYRIMEEQRKHHSILTEDLISKFHDIIFRQRELRQPEPGWCALIHGERRMQLAMPVYQKFRILQEVNNLEIDDFGEETSPITAEDRNVLVQILTQSFESVTNQGYLSWSKISKALGYKGKVVFNLERTGNKGIFCDRTSRELSEEGRFGKQWFAYDIDKQALVINQVLHETNNSKLLSWLIENIGVTSEQAQNICEARLQKGYGRLSEAAVKRLVPHMVNGFKYDKACQNEGINHSDRHTGEIFDKGDLPYYGEILSRHALG